MTDATSFTEDIAGDRGSDEPTLIVDVEAGGIARDGPDDLAMLQSARSDDQGVGRDVVVAQIGEQVGARHRLQGFLRAGDGASEGLAGPEGGVEQFLNVMLWLVQNHRHLFFDDLALLVDLDRVEP